MDIKNFFGKSINFNTFIGTDIDLRSEIDELIKSRNQLDMSRLITQLDIVVADCLLKDRTIKHVLVPGLMFKNEDMLVINREAFVGFYAQKGISMEFVFADLPTAGKPVIPFRFGVNIDVTWYVEVSLR